MKKLLTVLVVLICALFLLATPLLGAGGMGSSSGANGHDMMWTGSFLPPGAYDLAAYNHSDVKVTATILAAGDNVTTIVNGVPTKEQTEHA